MPGQFPRYRYDYILRSIPYHPVPCQTGPPLIRNISILLNDSCSLEMTEISEVFLCIVFSLSKLPCVCVTNQTIARSRHTWTRLKVKVVGWSDFFFLSFFTLHFEWWIYIQKPISAYQSFKNIFSCSQKSKNSYLFYPSSGFYSRRRVE